MGGSVGSGPRSPACACSVEPSCVLGTPSAATPQGKGCARLMPFLVVSSCSCSHLVAFEEAHGACKHLHQLFQSQKKTFCTSCQKLQLHCRPTIGLVKQHKVPCTSWVFRPDTRFGYLDQILDSITLCFITNAVQASSSFWLMHGPL